MSASGTPRFEFRLDDAMIGVIRERFFEILGSEDACAMLLHAMEAMNAPLVDWHSVGHLLATTVLDLQHLNFSRPFDCVVATDLQMALDVAQRHHSDLKAALRAELETGRKSDDFENVRRQSLQANLFCDILGAIIDLCVKGSTKLSEVTHTLAKAEVTIRYNFLIPRGGRT